MTRRSLFQTLAGWIAGCGATLGGIPLKPANAEDCRGLCMVVTYEAVEQCRQHRELVLAYIGMGWELRRNPSAFVTRDPVRGAYIIRPQIG